MVTQKVERPAHKYSNKMEEVRTLVKAGAPFIWIRTHEEARCLDELDIEIGEKLRREMHCWSATSGLIPFNRRASPRPVEGPLAETINPMKCLNFIANMSKPAKTNGIVFVMRDFQIVLQEPIPRKMRDMYQDMEDGSKTMIIVSASLAHGAGGGQSGLPPSLEKQIVVVDYDLPSREHIEDSLRTIVANSLAKNAPSAEDQPKTKDRKELLINNMKDYTDQQYFEASRALQGLTTIEVDNTASSSIQHCLGLNLEFLLNSKKQLVSRGEILEYIEVNNTMEDIGGLDAAKKFFKDYVKANSPEAQAFGVKPLRGVLLVGVPGTGKSALSKAIGHTWKVPLLRLDVGKVMTGLVGGSEGKMRQVINQVEAVAPCVLWIDEVEKALSGTKSSNHSDGGTMARVFGTLLTAMEEGLKGVTFIATANDISALPPEFIRRFSEVFFVDLPGPDERKDIFRIHLRKNNRNPDDKVFSLAELVERSEDYTGAEIEKAVERGIALAFNEEEMKLKNNHILEALSEIKPISKLMSEKIKKLRSEANGRYRYASSWAQSKASEVTQKKKEMSLDELDLIPAERKKVKEPQVKKAGRNLGLDTTDEESGSSSEDSAATG